MINDNHVDTPMDPSGKLVPNLGEPYCDPGKHRRLVGKLNKVSFPTGCVIGFILIHNRVNDIITGHMHSQSDILNLEGIIFYFIVLIMRSLDKYMNLVVRVGNMGS